jgi:uncharacterized membrane protein YqgA involved in biofilm formation
LIKHKNYSVVLQFINAFIKLKALGLQPSKEALTSYGNTATAMGKSLDQMIEAVADASTAGTKIAFIVIPKIVRQGRICYLKSNLCNP